MVVDYLSSQLDWAGYQVSTKRGSGSRHRRHSSIGNKSPVDFENVYHQPATAAAENAA